MIANPLAKALLALTLAFSAVACVDREQRARRDGQATRAAVASSCAARAEEDRDACAHAACRASCAPYHDGAPFFKACEDACLANGACATDADCGDGLRCVAIAPVVRRCQPR